MITRLVWFRNDLRVTDNTALNIACMNQDIKVIALFISTPDQWDNHNVSFHQAGFIYLHLLDLKQELLKLNIPLFYKECSTFIDSIKWLNDFCYHQKISEIFYNKQYELNEINRDNSIKCYLTKNIVIKSFDDLLIIPPGKILNKKNQMYKKYSPFRNKFIQMLSTNHVVTLPKPKIRSPSVEGTIDILPFNYPLKFSLKEFPIGEEKALSILFCFFNKKIFSYNPKDIFTSSKISPYLSIGVISCRQCFSLLMSFGLNMLMSNISLFAFLNELIWREFYYHLIFSYSFLCQGKSLISWTNNIPWENNKDKIEQWKLGETGFPIVDAAMRQLNATGWIHNRLRMVSACFLVKNLLVDWRIGEHYFMSKLIDGVLSSNNGNWQWIASVGTDSMPYFRFFNPNVQLKLLDAKGDLIFQWIPELKPHFNHKLNLLEKNLQDKITIKNYPKAIVDYNLSCKKTLNIFKFTKLNFKSK